MLNFEYFSWPFAYFLCYLLPASLILLCISIEKYEKSADEFQAFNQSLSEMDSGVSALATLMDQHGLNTTDFSNEIGGKSLVSMILNQKRRLNLGHIRKLADRFNVPPQIFI